MYTLCPTTQSFVVSQAAARNFVGEIKLVYLQKVDGTLAIVKP